MLINYLQPVVRLYKLPQDTFEDDAEEEEAEDEDEQGIFLK